MAQSGKTSNTTTASTMVTRGTDNIRTDSTDRMGRTDNRHSTVSMDTENRLAEQKTECNTCQTLSEITCTDLCRTTSKGIRPTNNLFMSVCL